MQGRVALDEILETMTRRHYEWWRGYDANLPAWDDLDPQMRRRHRKAMRLAVFDYLDEQELSICWRPFDTLTRGILSLTPENE